MYVPEDAVASDQVLALQKMPTHYELLNAARDNTTAASDDQKAVASYPVICWLCGDGFSSKQGLNIAAGRSTGNGYSGNA